MKNKRLLLVIGIIVLLVIVMQPNHKESKKLSSATITRDLPSSATNGQPFTVTLTVSGTSTLGSGQNYWSLYENVDGYTITSVTSGYNCDYQANPDYLSCYISSGANDVSFSYTATSDNPTGITFSGKYLFGTDTTQSDIGGENTITPSSCTSNSQCNDNNVCTIDTCSSGSCSYSDNDGVSCTGGTCQGGDCVPDCIIIWSCTGWSPSTCPASCTQTQTCTDTNNCGDNSNKPAESRSCTGGNCAQVCTKVDGGWSAYGSCIDGVQTRTCTNPAPSCNGAQCSGSATQSCEQTCEDRLNCEIWEECNDAGTACEMAGWVIMALIAIGVMFALKMVTG